MPAFHEQRLSSLILGLNCIQAVCSLCEGQTTILISSPRAASAGAGLCVTLLPATRPEGRRRAGSRLSEGGIMPPSTPFLPQSEGLRVRY